MLSKKQIEKTLNSDKMPSLIVNELDRELQNKLKRQYPSKEELIKELKYDAVNENSAVLKNELTSKLKFKLKDYQDSNEFLFYLKNSQKMIEIHDYKMEQFFEDIPLEDSDVYKSIANNEDTETYIIMKAPEFNEEDKLNISIKVDGKFKGLDFYRIAYDSKKEMKYLYQTRYIKIFMLIEKNLEYISWGFHHLFNESIGEVNTINIIDTYKMLIALASGEMYTTNKIKFNNDSASKNKEILESLNRDLKLFEIIHEFQNSLDKEFKISTPFNSKEIIEGVKTYFLLYKQKLILEEKRLESLLIKTSSFDLEDIKGKKFTLIQEEEVTKTIFTQKISYTQYQCYYQVKSSAYEQLQDDEFKLKFNPEDVITIILKASFNTIEPIGLENIAFEEAETLDAFISNYKSS